MEGKVETGNGPGTTSCGPPVQAVAEFAGGTHTSWKACKAVSGRCACGSSDLRLRGDDLLPLDVRSLDGLFPEEPDFTNVLKLMFTTLNYLWLGGKEATQYKPPESGKLTRSQMFAVRTFAARVRDLITVDKLCPDFQTARSWLVEAKFDYGGEPIMTLDELVAEQVVAVWPGIGEAAVQPVVDYLPDDLKAKMLDPLQCLLPIHEWPAKPPKSRVRATQAEWDKIVGAAYSRGLMVAVDLSAVFKDMNGQPILNGAAAVKKLKKVGGEVKTMQRFISNFIPSNAYQQHIVGGDKYLPYLGQLTLLEQEEDETWVCDSEDFTSCYSLFTLPSAWWPYMCFGKLVDAKLLGGPPGKMVYPAMAVVPMGWINAVSIVQSVVRTLVFQEADIPEDTEVTKMRQLPEGDGLTVIYLDSYDELRKLDKSCLEILSGVPSARHQAFSDMCKRKGLPLNEGKRVIASVRGSLQGGELQGDLGWYKLAGDKQVNLIALGACLLGLEEWREFDVRHFIGKAVFGMCFRRPLLSIFQEVFSQLQDTLQHGSPQRPTQGAMDEVVMAISMVPMMGTCLTAMIDQQVYCSDASPSGGGVAVATQFRPEPFTSHHEGSACWECGGEMDDELRYPCPARCGVALCSLTCLLRHRSDHQVRDRRCRRIKWELPRFGERFAGKHGRLTEAVAMEGDIDVQVPYDLHFGHDFRTREGKEALEELMDDPLLMAEHWAPCCKLFSKARGRPIRLQDGRTIQGPQPVRDRQHLMGFPWLSSGMKVRLRHSNAMALKTLKRLESGADRDLYLSAEHPYGSWMWEFKVAEELLNRGYRDAVGSHCCFGGRREKWYRFRVNSEHIARALTRECPGHDDLLPYEVTQDEDGQLVYDTSKEEEYPWQLCREYARGLHEQLAGRGIFRICMEEAFRDWYKAELEVTTERLRQPQVAAAVAVELTALDLVMRPGEERRHLKALWRNVSYRGTDFRAYVYLTDESEEKHEMPYPALRWEWKTLMSWPWKQEAHINELELCSVVATIKHRGRTADKHSKRWFCSPGTHRHFLAKASVIFSHQCAFQFALHPQVADRSKCSIFCPDYRSLVCIFLLWRWSIIGLLVVSSCWLC
eukprot:Skav226631  [mRNA]  locus=scaffold2041:555283:567851:+ [translate_table: standard]